MLLSPRDAFEAAAALDTIATIGDSSLPLLACDFRRSADASTLSTDDCARFAEALAAVPWVAIAIVDETSAAHSALVALIDCFDVVLAETDVGTTAVVGDPDAQLGQLRDAVAASPEASVALVQLLRSSCDAPVERALHLESLTYGLLQTGATFQAWLAQRRAAPPTGDEGSVVSVERDDSLLRIRLSRPDRRNALNVAMRDQLSEALELLVADRSLDGAVLDGAGANFCAGGDLDEFGSTPSPAIGHHVRSVRSLPRLMHRVRDRVRVQLHGACIGAGIELSAFAGSVIADPDTTFRLPEVGFGLVPGAGGTVSVTRRCGRQRTAWLALTGKTIGTDTALAWGLIDAVRAAPT